MARSYYEVLGVSKDASPEEVLAARQRRARLVDPTRLRHKAPEEQAVAAELLHRLDTAFNILEDEKTRRSYDQALATGQSFTVPEESEDESQRRMRELIAQEFQAAIDLISGRIETYIRNLDPDIVWATEDPGRGEHWQLVLAGQKEAERYRVHLEVVADLHPNHLIQRLMESDAALEQSHAISEGAKYVYFLIGGQVTNSGRLYTTAEAFNQGAWNQQRTGRPRAYVAYANLDGGFPLIPGVADPSPDLAQLTVATEQSTTIPPMNQEEVNLDGQESDEFLVLVVDDERLPFELAKRYLRGEPYKLDHAVDWIEFKKLIHEKKYAAVLLDIQLPTLSGDKLALYVNSNPDITPKPRIVLFSSLEEDKLRSLAAKVGAHAFLRKGCPAELMRHTMRTAARAYARDCIMMGPW
jgi:curved DNA-binding protein CbpA